MYFKMIKAIARHSDGKLILNDGTEDGPERYMAEGWRLAEILPGIREGEILFVMFRG